MKFLIISDAPTLYKKGEFYSYAPYVHEINLWAQNVDSLTIVSPIKYKKKLLLDSFKTELKVSSIPAVSLVSPFNVIKTLLNLPYIFYKLFVNMYKADHIHLRNPGSIGLLACITQIFFPFKSKTSKYAGNWDPKSVQPLSYRIQKWILSNTLLTRNIKVLVYGEWANQSKNIIPFFTASYNKDEIENIKTKNLSSIIKFIFVGTFSVGKRPMLSVKVIERLFKEGFNVQLNMYGNGDKYIEIQNYIKKKSLENTIFLHGNKPKSEVKQAFKESHFLLFISKSEGWPKVVAEAMFWSCLPISSNVSCVNYMLGNGSRGSVLKPDINIDDIIFEIKRYLNDEKKYQEKVLNATKWSQEYTLDKFEVEIKKILDNNYE